MRLIDCRGLACPAPVLRAKETIEGEGPAALTIVVDNEAAKENVSRFLGSQDFEVSAEEKDGSFYITGRKDKSASLIDHVIETPRTDKKKIMVMVATDRIGKGDDELGSKLMVSFIKTLREMGDELWRLVLLNNGVKLTVKDSEVLSSLKALQDRGVQIGVCGTCLTHFDLLDKKQVGETTNMLDIVTAMQLADKVINI